MSLQVWLPLNKDLRNVGISNASPINHGGTINNSGMIGNCYEFAGTSGKYLDTGYGNGVNAKNISVCLWVKPLSSLNDKILLGVVGDSGINKRLYLGVKSNTYNIAYGSTTWGRTSNAVVTLNEWQHLCIVVKNRTATLYLNGNLTDETKTYNTDFDFQTNIFIGGRTDGFNSNILVNDVRIYDNALTERDIKRIFQTKIFDLGIYSKNKNIISYKNISENNGWGSFGYGRCGQAEISDISPYQTSHAVNIKNSKRDNVIEMHRKEGKAFENKQFEISNNAVCGCLYYGDKVTFSCYIKSDTELSGETALVSLKAHVLKHRNDYTTQQEKIKVTDDWQKISTTLEWCGDDKTNARIEYRIAASQKVKKLYACNFQLYLGDEKKEYYNTQREKFIYSKAGIDNICDYKNFSIEEDCLYLNGNGILKYPNSNISIKDGTILIWLYANKISKNYVTYLHPQIIFEKNGNEFFIKTNSKDNNKISSYALSQIKYNEFNCIVITFTDYKSESCYLNGNKIEETQMSGIIDMNTNCFTNFYGKIKNIKIFKKRLSEEEILKLYRQNENQ